MGCTVERESVWVIRSIELTLTRSITCRDGGRDIRFPSPFWLKVIQAFLTLPPTSESLQVCELEFRREWGGAGNVLRPVPGGR